MKAVLKCKGTCKLVYSLSSGLITTSCKVRSMIRGIIVADCPRCSLNKVNDNSNDKTTYVAWMACLKGQFDSSHGSAPSLL